MSGIPVCLTFRKMLFASVFGVGLFLIPNGVQSAVNNSATLQWADNQEPDLGGYTVYHGTNPGIYSDSRDAGITATYRYANLASNETHYFSVTAYDKSGNESLPSPEVHKTIIAPDSVLSVSVAGDGTIRSSPAGLSCSSGTCSGTFTQGSTVTLTATPGIGKIFDGWNGACLGTGSCVVPISTSSASVSANFTSSPSVSPPPSWSVEQEQQLTQTKEQKQLAQAELIESKKQKDLAQAQLIKSKEQYQLAQSQEQKQLAQEKLTEAREQKRQAQAKLLEVKEQKKLAQAKIREAKLVKDKAKIIKIQNALAIVEAKLAKPNKLEVVARLNAKKEKYSRFLARMQEKYSLN